MKYWLTTHWPPRIDEPIGPRPVGVWLQHDKLHVADDMTSGDLVFIYQAGSGKAVRESYADGTTKIIPRSPGRQGLISLGRILDRPSQPENSQPEQYSDGSERWWRYRAPVQVLNSAGFIPRPTLAVELGYKPSFAFRGFGKEHSGLAQLDETVFHRLKEQFLNPLLEQDEETKRFVRRHRGHGKGGEGPRHLALKLAIAADPSTILREPGLRHFATEYQLPTGDTIDVVLLDEYARFVVVEVEVDCNEEEVIGPLQCAKYRALMSYLHHRTPDEVRTILVAHGIHDAVAMQCREYRIECCTATPDLPSARLEGDVAL